MYVLKIGQDLDGIREEISKRMERPVYISGGTTGYFGTDFKKPRSTKYVPMGVLELYLSTLTDGGYCVKREPVDDNPSHDRYYYDLQESDALYIVFPVHRGEKLGLWTHPIFQEMGLGYGGSTRLIQPNIHDTLHGFPKELEPYYEERPNHRGQKVKQIRFAESDIILAPTHRQEKWSIGTTLETTEKRQGFSTLHPPGFYCDSQVPSSEYFNNLAICERDPGGCIVCGGKKGERKHFSVVKIEPAGGYTSNLICKGCFRESMNQIADILEK